MPRSDRDHTGSPDHATDVTTSRSGRERFEAADPELWDRLVDTLIEQDPWPDEVDEPDPLGGIAMRTYEVVEVRRGDGARLAECSVTTEERPLFWFADARAAELFTLGDIFGFGWNDEETFVWPPESRRRNVPAA